MRPLVLVDSLSLSFSVCLSLSRCSAQKDLKQTLSEVHSSILQDMVVWGEQASLDDCNQRAKQAVTKLHSLYNQKQTLLLQCVPRLSTAVFKVFCFCRRV